MKKNILYKDISIKNKYFQNIKIISKKMLVKEQKYYNSKAKNIQNKKGKNNDIIVSKEIKNYNNKPQIDYKINKVKNTKRINYSKNPNENSYENKEKKDILSIKKNKLKEKKTNNIINTNRSEENRNIFKTKYDYILEKSKNANGPVEIPPDIEIQKNLNQKEWSSQKKKLNENVKRSDIIKKIKIFNNKKNNDICSDLLKTVKNNEKKLIIFPYAREKQKINKTIHTIGNSNGVTYPKTSLLSGGNENNTYNNFINKIRFDRKNNNDIKMNIRLNLFKNQYPNKAKIDLTLDDNNYYY